MMKRKLVITGSQGFIATNLILKLAESKNFELHGMIKVPKVLIKVFQRFYSAP